MKSPFLRHVVVAVTFLFLTEISLADQLPAPTGKVVLIVTGNIDKTNVDDTAQFDIEMLENFPVTTFKTSNDWVEGITEFTGVRVSELLQSVGASSYSFRALALDRYHFDVSGIDFDKIPAIIAYKKNGKFMRVRELGPLWIMFPFDEYPETDTEQHRNASVWQLAEIKVK